MNNRGGKRNIRPTKPEVAGYYALLRSAADNGDILAAAELIKIDYLARQREPGKGAMA